MGRTNVTWLDPCTDTDSSVVRTSTGPDLWTVGVHTHPSGCLRAPLSQSVLLTRYPFVLHWTLHVGCPLDPLGTFFSWRISFWTPPTFPPVLSHLLRSSLGKERFTVTGVCFRTRRNWWGDVTPLSGEVDRPFSILPGVLLGTTPFILRTGEQGSVLDETYVVVRWRDTDSKE